MKSVIIFLSLVSLACGYHILCIQYVPSKSHYNLMMGIVKPLLEAGHQITMITTFPDEKPVKNLNYIDVSHLIKLVPKHDMSDRATNSLTIVKSFARNLSRSTIETPAVQNALIKQNFDAVVTEWFFSDYDAGYSAVQQIPWISLSGMVMHTHMEYLIDTVRSVTTHPTLLNDFPMPMNFWQRLFNTGSYLLMSGSMLLDYNTNRAIYESQFNSIAAARGVVLPPYANAIHNISILFVNSHPSFAPAMSLPPNVVDIAGYHIDENIPALPKDLQDLLDSSSKGVVYFSMGSVVKSAQLPEKIRRSLIKAFSELPYTVLWKFEEKIDGLPKNVHVRPWMPQSSILSHPNIKVFITHGGLLSTLESLYHGVPIIAVPVFGDQPANAKRCVREGRALMVELNEHIGEELGKALKEILSNDSYYKRAKYLSKLFRNRPVKTAKLIQHYVELAIESKGAYHLRSKTHDYAWYELWMFDQVAFVLVIIYIIISLIKKVVSSFKKKENQKGKKQKKHYYYKRAKYLSKLFRNRPVKTAKLIQQHVALALESEVSMKLVIIFLSLVSLACGYHILCIQNVATKSHYNLMMGIVKPLLEAGHQVTMVTTFPDEKPIKNLNYIDVSHLIKIMPRLDMSDTAGINMAFVKSLARNLSRNTIETPALRDALINQNFDAVVTEFFVSEYDAGYSAIQQVPWILLNGVVMDTHMEYLIDTVRSVTTHPTLLNDFPMPMNFWQRLFNTGSYLLLSGSMLLDYKPNKAIYESQFTSIAAARGVVLPPYAKAIHNISILFVSSHPSFAPAMSLPPNVVDIGGYHIDENIPALPKDLQDLLDSSSKGVVYFSMGSVVKSAQLPEKIRKSLIKAFSELPYTVLWKFEEKIEGLPKNVHVRPWMPQSSILSHPNIKVFITHGGLLSTLESLYHGVPIIAVPVFGDQPSNANRCVREGRALMVELNEHIGEELGKALKEILSNDSYYKRAKYLSKLFRNRPVKTAKLIQHYVELAIESKGAYHLRSKTHDYAWYELWMLDQVAFVLVIIYIIISLIKKVVSSFKKKENQKGKKQKKH